LIIDLNEEVLIESVLRTISKSIEHPDCDNWLVENFITGNLYREHNDKNFDDKIFFYEPINKYCDLLWLKRVVFKLIKSK
jgi:hypothetical protein